MNVGCLRVDTCGESMAVPHSVSMHYTNNDYIGVVKAVILT